MAFADYNSFVPLPEYKTDPRLWFPQTATQFPAFLTQEKNLRFDINGNGGNYTDYNWKPQISLNGKKRTQPTRTKEDYIDFFKLTQVVKIRRKWRLQEKGCKFFKLSFLLVKQDSKSCLKNNELNGGCWEYNIRSEKTQNNRGFQIDWMKKRSEHRLKNFVEKNWRMHAMNDPNAFCVN